MAVVLEVLYLSPFLFQFLWGVKSDICLSGIQQLTYILLVNVTALTLTIGTFVPAKRDTLVKLDAQPAERLNDILLCPRHKTVGIGILDAEHQVAAMLTGKKVVIQCRTYSSYM